MLTDTRKSPYARVSFTARCRWTRGFLKDRFDTTAQAAIPHILSIFDDPSSFFHEVENFRIAAGLAEGAFRGNPYGDGDFYKLLEAMACAGYPQAQLDGYVRLIAAAQQADGYLSTKQIIGERQSGGATRHSDVDDFEEYNFGHLCTAACVLARETGDTALLAVASRVCDYLEAFYRRLLAGDGAQTAVCPSHYMGLAEMYRQTGEHRYLTMLQTAITLRDRVANGNEDNQDRIPLRAQRVISGHAVRATYLYAGVTDLYLETGDETVLPTLEACWRNLLDTKLYIIGGLGALYTGCSPFGDLIGAQRVHQAFGYEYQLPNVTAYNETCAALGGVFWAQRRFAAQPDAEAFDLIERVTCNLAAAAISLDGQCYFYENMLRRTETVPYSLMWPRERSDTFQCFCCPTNLSRFFTETGYYAYAQSADGLYTGLYGEGETAVRLDNGAAFTVRQQTDYPWDGHIRFTFADAADVPFTLMLRIPAWSQVGRLTLNGRSTALNADHAGRYLPVAIRHPGTDTVELTLDMTPRLTVAHPMVEEDEGQACVERGPLVYCLESADNGSLNGLYFAHQQALQETRADICGTPVVLLRAKGYRRQLPASGALYRRFGGAAIQAVTLTLLPYFAWDNRGFGEMRIWLPLAVEPNYDINS
jgi:hypothetical protein